MSTEWTLEGPTTIGNNIVNMIDTRESDGMVAVGTCGHGMITGNFAPASYVREPVTQTAKLEQNAPNPFAKSTDITFSLKHDAVTSLDVYDQLGRLCSKLLNGRLTAGEHVATWDAAGEANGAYYYQLKVDGETLVGQMILRR
jgi:hypothetical protein